MPQPTNATPAQSPPSAAPPAKSAAPPTSAPAAAPSAPAQTPSQSIPASKPSSFHDDLSGIAVDDPRKGTEQAPRRGEQKKPPTETKPPVDETKHDKPETESTGDETKTDETETPETTGSLGDDLDAVLKKPQSNKQNGASTPKQLREAYESQKKELATHQAKVKELEAAVAKAADQGRVQAEAVLQKRLDDVLAERDRLDSEMRYTRYESSSEFKTNYEKPIQQAYAAAQRDLEGVRVVNSDGVERDATLEDLVPLLQLPAAQARRHAASVFGEDAPIAMDHVGRIRQKIDSMNAARAEWREKGSQRQAELQEQHARQQKAYDEHLSTKEKELAELAPEIFGDPKDDPEESALVQKGGDIVDIALGRKGFKEGTSPEEQMKARAHATAHVVARARHFGRVVRQLNSLKEKLAAAEEKLKSYETSEPTPTPAAGDKPNRLQTPEEGLAALAVSGP